MSVAPDKRRRARTTTMEVTARVEGGRLKATGVPPGRLLFTHLRGSAWAQPLRLTVKPGAVHRTGTLHLHPGGTLRGTVVKDRKPVPFATVHALRRRAVHPVRADERGQFHVTGLAPGIYTIRHARQTDESAFANRELNVDDGFETKAVVELLPD